MTAPLPNPSERRAARLAVFAGAARDVARFGAVTLTALALANVFAPAEQVAPLNAYAREYGRWVWTAGTMLVAMFIVSRVYEQRNDLAQGDTPEDALVRLAAELRAARESERLMLAEHARQLESARCTAAQALLRKYGCTEDDLQALQTERALRALADEHAAR